MTCNPVPVVDPQDSSRVGLPPPTPHDRLYASLLYCLAEARFVGVSLVVYLLEMAVLELEMTRQATAG